MRHLEGEALDALVAVAETGGFTSAAERLGKTQGAVSMAIARLEGRLGQRLFERSHRRIAPTAAGDCLLAYARQMQKIEAEALTVLMGGVTASRVRLGMPDDFIDTFGSALLHRFSPRHRNIHIDLTCDFSRKLRLMMDNGELDVAVLTQTPDDRRGELIRYERQIWCTGPTGCPEREEYLPLALFSGDCVARPRICAILDRAGRPWRLAYSSSHIAGIRLAAAAGGLLTVLPESAVPDGWRRLGEDDGLPALPAMPIAVAVGQGERLAARKVAAFLESEFTRPHEFVDGEEQWLYPAASRARRA